MIKHPSSSANLLIVYVEKQPVVNGKCIVRSIRVQKLGNTLVVELASVIWLTIVEKWH